MVDKDRINNTMGKMAYYLQTHNVVCVSVSGGADSDIIVHIIATYFREFLPKIHFMFSNTGIEYQATLRHLDELEEKYDIRIERIKGMPIPVAVKTYGTPFLSKQVSEFIGRLQKHNFDFSVDSYENLERKFDKCQSALRWWSNTWAQPGHGKKSRFNINWNSGLQEFMMSNKPEFLISSMCCQKSKKDPLIKYQKSVGCDLSITGERKAEKGARARKNNCFEKSNGFDHYMPLFLWDDDTRAYYENSENIVHSDCYTVYGLKRTGCVGCPFAMDYHEELEIMKKYEPKLYRLCMAVFGESYAYMDKYYEDRKQRHHEAIG